MIRISTFFLCLVLLMLSACKRDSGIDDFAVIEVDFLTNDRDLEKFGLEYTPEEFERDTGDPNKVLKVRVGENVKFKDISKGASSASKRKWMLDDNEWKEISDSKKTDVPEFEFAFPAPGLYKITLIINEFNEASKYIEAVEGGIPSTESQIAMEADTPQDEQPADDLFADNTSTSSSSTSNSNQRETTPTPPRETNTSTSSTPPAREAAKPVVFSSVNFTMQNKEVLVGQTFELRDISKPASAVKFRQWDTGDGSIKKIYGPSYRKSYFTPGEKTITLCLNGTTQCVSKRIVVKPQPPKRKEAEPETVVKPKEPEVAKKPEVQTVEFNMQTEAIAGETVNLADRSAPGDAVNTRTWSFGDGTTDLTTGRTAISHVFTAAGTYEVKLCVNNESDKCVIKKIVVKAKPEPVATTTAPTDDPYANYDGSRLGRVGLLSSQKCDEQTFSWHEGEAYINIVPKEMMELDEVKVYADKNATLDFVLTSEDTQDKGYLRNVQVNPGSTVIYMTDLAVILRPGQKYTLLVKPSDPSSGLRLENSQKCKPNPLASDQVSVNYNDNFILYDLKFYY